MTENNNNNYYDDPIITSQGTLILAENIETYCRRVEQEDREKAYMSLQHTSRSIGKKSIKSLSFNESSFFIYYS